MAARYARLIAFLEREAAFLRSRLETLEGRDVNVGVDTGAGEDSDLDQSLRETKDKLVEIKEHIAELKAAPN